MNVDPVYLDWNATAPVLPAAAAAMQDAMAHAWANPSSSHGPGQVARGRLIEARAQIAACIGAQPAEIVFTSGATEANHMAVLGALAMARSRGRNRLVLSAVEHPGHLALAERLVAEGWRVDRIPVDGQGRLDLVAARSLIGPEVALVSVMGANNETGVVMPVAEVGVLAHEQGAWLHVDATQVLGKAPLCFAAGAADLMSVSAHKIGGPKGVGALIVRKGCTIAPLIAGRQERQRRGGTENLPGIAGFAAACTSMSAALAADLEHMRRLRDQLEQGLVQMLPHTRVLGAGAQRLPNTSCLSFGALPAEIVLTRLENAGVVASSGAACSAGATQASHVLLAMGLDEDAARRGVRFSLGRATRADDIARAQAAAAQAVLPLLAEAGALAV